MFLLWKSKIKYYQVFCHCFSTSSGNFTIPKQRDKFAEFRFFSRQLSFSHETSQNRAFRTGAPFWRHFSKSLQTRLSGLKSLYISPVHCSLVVGELSFLFGPAQFHNFYSTILASFININFSLAVCCPMIITK